jgi:hypothetical protein
MEKIAFDGGNASLSLICVGEIAGAGIVTEFIGLEMVREILIKRQREEIFVFVRGKNEKKRDEGGREASEKWEVRSTMAADPTEEKV